MAMHAFKLTPGQTLSRREDGSTHAQEESVPPWWRSNHHITVSLGHVDRAKE